MASSTRAASWVASTCRVPKLASLDSSTRSIATVARCRPGIDWTWSGLHHCGLCLRNARPSASSHEATVHVAAGQIKEASLDSRRSKTALQSHIYQCFNCRACETACPSGVQSARCGEARR